MDKETPRNVERKNISLARVEYVHEFSTNFMYCVTIFLYRNLSLHLCIMCVYYMKGIIVIINHLWETCNVLAVNSNTNSRYYLSI